MNIRNQLRSFYAFEALLSCRITDAVWVLFLLGRGYDLAQVGLAEGIFHITSLVCEVPSWIGIPMLVIPLGGVIGALFASKRKISLWKTAFICGFLGGSLMMATVVGLLYYWKRTIGRR